mgnify:CR=1 FL=1
MRPLLIALLVLLSGCAQQVRRNAVPPQAVVAAGGTVVEQKGEAQTPATARVEEKRQTVTLPTGTVVWQDAKSGEIKYRLDVPAVLAAETKVEQATAPAAFTPPAAPTVKEEAEAKADYWTIIGYRVGVFVGIAAAIFGVTRNWPMVMWGGISVAGACLAGLFIKSHPVLLVFIGAGVLLKVVGPLLWHTKLKHLQPSEPTSS